SFCISTLKNPVLLRLLWNLRRLLMLGNACHQERAIPVDLPSEVHGNCNRQETDTRTYEQRVVLESQQHVDECVQQSEDGQSPYLLRPTREYPTCIGRKQDHRGSSRNQKAKVETDSLGEG